MKRHLVLRVAVVGIAVSLGVPLSLLATSQVSAQANPTILQALEGLQRSVNGLAAQLGVLATASTVISTGFSFKPSGFAGGCVAQNVGTSPATVATELRNIRNERLEAATLSLDPGRGDGIAQPRGLAADSVWCRFIMVSGSSADIRANL